MRHHYHVILVSPAGFPSAGSSLDCELNIHAQEKRLMIRKW